MTPPRRGFHSRAVWGSLRLLVLSLPVGCGRQSAEPAAPSPAAPVASSVRTYPCTVVATGRADEQVSACPCLALRHTSFTARG